QLRREFVELKMAAHEAPNGARRLFLDEILQFEALGLQAVCGHCRGQMTLRNDPCFIEHENAPARAMAQARVSFRPKRAAENTLDDAAISSAAEANEGMYPGRGCGFRLGSVIEKKCETSG